MSIVLVCSKSNQTCHRALQLKALSPYKKRAHDQYQLLFNHKQKLPFNPHWNETKEIPEDNARIKKSLVSTANDFSTIVR